MEIIIKGESNEIAALVLAAQGRRRGVNDPLENITKSVQKAIDGIAQGEQPAL